MKNIIPRVLCVLLACAFSLPAAVVEKEKDNVPSVLENGAIVRRNGIYYNNRPLYDSHGNPKNPAYWVYGGDRPLVRFGGNPWVDGCFVLGFQNAAGEAKWLLDFKSVEFRYHVGRVEWVASDPAFPGVTISLHALPLGVGTGMAAQAQVTGAAAGDRLVWMLGAAYYMKYVSKFDVIAPESKLVRYEGFDPKRAEGDRVEFKNGVIRLEPPRGDQFRYSLTACSATSEFHVADADQWKTPLALLASPGGKRPVVCGVTPITGKEPITWISRSWEETDKTAAAPNVAADFRTAWDRVESLQNRVVSHTPDARFDFMVRAATPAMDGLFRKGAFGHGCNAAYVFPLLGWRSTLGGVAYGWHERVLSAARYFFASQVKGETYLDDPKLRQQMETYEEIGRLTPTLTHPGNNPRFFSKGRLIPDSNSTMYDMQSQFIDAIVEDWRFTADPVLEKLLRPVLELHLDYIDRCFDPDGDGTYETFINTFLTDSVWVNGGGSPDETAFAWRGHLAARDMARRAGDTQALKRHEAKLALIRKGFFEKLWVDKQGHPGAYREQGGHQRLHGDAWLPGIYLPLDCPGLFNDEQAASTLYFTEYALEREPRPTGGVRVWPSNWVPTIWSNRTKAPGDEYHMALGYCLAGQPEGAMEIVRGNISEGAFESASPGNLGFPGGGCGTDFGDCVSAFTRTVVSGVFGYRPDRPNDLVTIAPQFPGDWSHASFAHPEFKLAYERQGTTERLSVELERESAMQLELPFCGTAVKAVRLNGREVKGTIKPGFGRSICVVSTPTLKKAELELEVARAIEPGVAQFREVEVGSPVTLSVDGGAITEVRDAQKVLESVKLVDGKASGRISNNDGNHRVLALVQMGKNAPQYRIFDFKVRDQKAEQYAAEKNLREAPVQAQWSGIDLSKQLNGRITDIFYQEYLSPRPDTMSVRIGKNGYSTWNGAYSGKLPPGIDLSNTRPRRPAPVYEAAMGDLKLGGDFTIEAWVTADMTKWLTTRILELGDLSFNLEPNLRVVNLRVGKTLIWSWPTLCSDRVTHLAAIVRSGKQAQFFLDGKANTKKFQEVDLAALASSPTLRLGADSKGDKRLLGQIQRVAISTQAVDEGQLKGRTVDASPLPGTVADWRIPATGGDQVASAVPGAPALVRREVEVKPFENFPELLKVSGGMLETPQKAKFLWKPGAKDIAFTSLWDNWPRKVEVPVNKKGDSAWLLVAGSTNPMQVRIANAVLRFEYADGVKEELELVNPMNFWSLCHFQMSDYDYKQEAFSLPKEPPSQVQLGSNCRAMVYGWKLRPGVELKSVTLESLSQEVVIGLMGVSICNPRE